MGKMEIIAGDTHTAFGLGMREKSVTQSLFTQYIQHKKNQVHCSIGRTVPPHMLCIGILVHTEIHIPVLLAETLSHLALHPGAHVIDCTAGYGGHSTQILKQIQPNGRLLCIDRDPNAIAVLQRKFAEAISSGQVCLFHGEFSQLETACAEHGFSQADAILADLGVSSPQLDTPTRGFSFQKDGPLDMRMNPNSETPSAQEFLQEVSEEELRNILWKYGEEPQGRKIARVIVSQREEHPLTTTGALASLIQKTVSYSTQSRKHPATKTFQALRIYLNGELQELEMWLPQALSVLRPKGRLCVLTFHSLEDRIVKHTLRQWANPPSLLPKDLPVYLEKKNILGTIIKPFPLNASPEESDQNPRARSAKLRVFEKGA